MEENLKKLKLGDTFDNGSLFETKHKDPRTNISPARTGGRNKHLVSHITNYDLVK